MNPERADCPIGHRVPLIQVKPEPDVAGHRAGSARRLLRGTPVLAQMCRFAPATQRPAMLRTAWSKRSQPLPCAPFSTPTGVDHDLAFRLRILWRQPRRFPGLPGSRRGPRPAPGRARPDPGLRWRRGRSDGHRGGRRIGRRRRSDRDHPAEPAGGRDRPQGPDPPGSGRRHARAGAHGRAGRRLRRPARRARHPWKSCSRSGPGANWATTPSRWACSK